ncbi:MAG: 1-acyl-sn-glycerol-3-phosphate acyltransferase [Clostridia bacterium]|nr:1-acyl-sn-glycerol-3-phosphate acyltransferase [Clostridia bacterium]
MKSGFYKVFHGTLRGPFMWLLRVHVHGAENEPAASDGPYIICANHTVFADPIFLCAATNRQQPHFMAKKELFRIPLLNLLIKSLGAFPVDRKGGDVSAIKKSIAMLKEGKCVGIFPQGHRNVGVNPRETEIHHGIGMIASRTHATILPCYLCMKDYEYKLGRRLDIVIGKPMSYEEYAGGLSGTAEYTAITEKVFDRICTLGEQFRDGEKSV